jgi:hypothetical protein
VSTEICNWVATNGNETTGYLPKYANGLRQVLWAGLFLAAPVAALQPAPRAVLTGSVIDATGSGLPGVNVRLVRPEGRWDERVVSTDREGRFSFASVPPGTYLFSAGARGFREKARVLRLAPGDLVDAGVVELALREFFPPDEATSVLTVCEALGRLDTLHDKPVLLLGNLVVRGERAWLNEDCDERLVTDALVWPSSILLGSDPPAANLRPKRVRDEERQVKTKAAAIKDASGSLGKIAVYGRLVSPDLGATLCRECGGDLVRFNHSPALLLYDPKYRWRRVE